MEINKIYQGNTLELLKQMPDEFIDCIITSPPYYGLRDYGVEGQLGLEPTLQEYLDKMLIITAELKRVLKKTGTMFWNHGDSYAGTPTGTMENYKDVGDKVYSRLYKRNLYPDPKNPASLRAREQSRDFGIPNKCLTMQNYRLAQRMVDEQNWILRNQIIWHKPNVMPSSIKDRFTVDFEPVFFFSKSKHYYFEQQYESLSESSLNDARFDKGREEHIGKSAMKQFGMNATVIKSIGRNKRTVWSIPTQPFSASHFAVFPEALIEPMIKAGSPEFVCKKCGKARELILKSNPEEREIEWHDEKYGENDKLGKRLGRMQPRQSVYNTSQKIGYTDCGCNEKFSGGIILDPFMGSGTVAVVAKRINRNFIGFELNPKYINIAEKRLKGLTNWWILEDIEKGVQKTINTYQDTTFNNYPVTP